MSYCYKYNPTTGQLDIAGTGGGSGSGDDHHSSWENITAPSTVTIQENKQMVVFGEFILDGTLNVDGSLILED